MTVTVTGPGLEDGKAPSPTAGISLAQYHAAHADRPGTWYVRVDGETAYTVERHPDRSITTLTSTRRIP